MLRPPVRHRQRTETRELRRVRDRRRYRRQLAGLAVAPVEYSAATIAYLEKFDWFAEGADHIDPRCIGDAISRMVQDSVEADEK